MSLTSEHSWAVTVTSEIDYTSIGLHERVGEPMNVFQRHSEDNHDRWRKVDEGMCYLRPPEGRATSEQITMVREQFGFTNEGDARDWFAFMTKGPAASAVDDEDDDNPALTTVKVGARVRLMPDADVRLTHNDYRCNPNSSLDIPIGVWLAVTEVAVTDDIVIIKVEGSERMVDMRWFSSRIGSRPLAA